MEMSDTDFNITMLNMINELKDKIDNFSRKYKKGINRNDRTEK